MWQPARKARASKKSAALLNVSCSVQRCVALLTVLLQSDDEEDAGSKAKKEWRTLTKQQQKDFPFCDVK